MLDRAARQLDAGRPQQALSLLSRISFLSLPLHARAEAFEKRGEAFQALGRFIQAGKSYRSSYYYYEILKENYGLFKVALHMGDVERQRERFESALRWYRHAEQFGKRLKNPGQKAAGLTDAACGKALSLRGLGKLDACRRELQKCAAQYKKRRDQEGEAYAYWGLGTTERFAGHLRKARTYLLKSVRLYQGVRDDSGWAYACCGLGGVSRLQGFAGRSARFYRQAYQVFKKHDDRFGMAYSCCGQGNAERMSGRYGRAMLFMRRAESLYRSLKQKSPLGFVLWNEAQTEIQLGLYARAAEHLKACRRLFSFVKDKRGLLYADLGMGEMWRSLNSKRSKIHYEKALRNAKRMGLKLEMVHAQRRLGCHSSDVWRNYQHLGVNASRFRSYVSLP